MKSWDDEWLKGKAGAWLASALMAAVAVTALLLCGCSNYTVVSADRRLVPVRHAPEVSADVYYRTGKDATGWYVPDALMLELLEEE